MRSTTENHRDKGPTVRGPIRERYFPCRGAARMESAKQQSDILLVEDNRADSTLLQMALLQYCALPYLIHVVNDGEAALKFLHQSAPYATAPCPDLIILDISLPKKDGWEVLAAIRATPVLRTIPVVMLTGVL